MPTPVMKLRCSTRIIGRRQGRMIRAAKLGQ